MKVQIAGGEIRLVFICNNPCVVTGHKNIDNQTAMIKTKQLRISATLKQLGSWLIRDNPKPVLTNPLAELPNTFRTVLVIPEDGPHIINNSR